MKLNIRLSQTRYNKVILRIQFEKYDNWFVKYCNNLEEAFELAKLKVQEYKVEKL